MLDSHSDGFRNTTTSGWNGNAVEHAVYAWNQSDVIDMRRVLSANDTATRRDCPMANGNIRSCNHD